MPTFSTLHNLHVAMLYKHLGKSQMIINPGLPNKPDGNRRNHQKILNKQNPRYWMPSIIKL